MVSCGGWDAGFEGSIASGPTGRIGRNTVGRIFIILICLVFLAGIALVGYAYSGFLQPDLQSVTVPVTLDVD